jgi:hypothetical protein
VKAASESLAQFGLGPPRRSGPVGPNGCGPVAAVGKEKIKIISAKEKIKTMSDKEKIKIMSR